MMRLIRHFVNIINPQKILFFEAKVYTKVSRRSQSKNRLISEGGKCTLGVHLSWEYYIVFIYVVLYELECSIYIFEC